jgi:hypothetical protein
VGRLEVWLCPMPRRGGSALLGGRGRLPNGSSNIDAVVCSLLLLLLPPFLSCEPTAVFGRRRKWCVGGGGLKKAFHASKYMRQETKRVDGK